MDILDKAMRGEIAIGSYTPLPSVKDHVHTKKKLSTIPVPAHRGRGGVVQRTEVGEGRHLRPVSLSAGTQVHRSVQGSLLDNREPDTEEDKDVKETRECEELTREESKTKELFPSDEPQLESGKEVGEALQPESQLSKRENSTLRELLRAIESYDRCVCPVFLFFFFFFLGWGGSVL